MASISVFKCFSSAIRCGLGAKPAYLLTKIISSKCRVIHSLKCQDFSAVSVEETERISGTRREEHKKSLAQANTKSAIYLYISDNYTKG